MAWDHRSLEGALYGLSSRPEARPATVRPLGTPAIPRMPDRIPQGITRRLDVDIALRHTLSEQDRRVVYEHYIHGQRHSYRERKRIIGTLLLALNGALDDDNR